MTKKYVETGTVFEFRNNQFMLELDSENRETGKIYLLSAEGIPNLLGIYVWGLDPFMYVTREVMPGHPATVAIRKRECKYLLKI